MSFAMRNLQFTTTPLKTRAAPKDMFVKKKHLARRLVNEITGYAASRLPDLTKAFSAELHRIGVRVAFDNFEIDRNSMAIVHEPLPAA